MSERSSPLYLSCYHDGIQSSIVSESILRASLVVLAAAMKAEQVTFVDQDIVS